MNFIDRWRYRDISVERYEKALHRSKNYFTVVNKHKKKPPKRVPVNDAIDFLLDTGLVPLSERQSIQGATFFDEDNIVVLQCNWSPTIDQLKDTIYQKIGWYPYTIGTFLRESDFSEDTDEWLEERNFNALEFPNRPVQEISLRDVSKGNGTAIMLYFDDLKILLDCCFNLEEPSICEIQEIPDVIFLSHAHFDHYASLAALASQIKGIPIIMSHTTLDLISYFQSESSEVQKYLKENAYALIFEDSYAINDEIGFKIYKAGHFPGAAMLYIYTPRHSILYTGDSCLYDLPPIKGSSSAFQNIHGSIDTLILDGRFCNEILPAQKVLLDQACEEAAQTLENGDPVLVFGDPGSWLLIFYIRFFFYFSQLKKKYQIYLDSQTLEIMEILRYRHEDITETLSKRILRFHDPFASIMRQDLAQLELNQRDADDAFIVLFNSKRYSTKYIERYPYLERIFQNPNALVILTWPLRREPLRLLGERGAYYNPSFKYIECRFSNCNQQSQSFGLNLHFDGKQILQVLHQTNPAQVFLFHQATNYFRPFIRLYMTKYQQYYPFTKMNALEPDVRFILDHPFKDVQTSTPVRSDLYHFLPLIDILEGFLLKEIKEVTSSNLSKQLTQIYPYWKDQTGFNKVSQYLTAAEAAGLIKLDRSGADIIAKLVIPAR